MNIVAEIFSRKRAKDREAKQPLNAKYMALVRDLAQGAEIDESDVFEITDAMGVPESQWSKDVETARQRLSWATQLKQGRDAAVTRQRSEQQIEALNIEYRQFMDAWQPRMNAAVETFKEAELTVSQTGFAESRLIATCYDPDILERQARLNKRRAELVEGFQELEQAANERRQRIRYAESMVEDARAKNEREPKAILENQGAWLSRKKDQRLLDAEEALRREQVNAQAVFADVARIKQGLADLDREQAQLNQEKLKP